MIYFKVIEYYGKPWPCSTRCETEEEVRKIVKTVFPAALPDCVVLEFKDDSAGFVKTKMHPASEYLIAS